MAFHPVEYVKAHPVAGGIIIVVGGIIFIMVTGIFSGGGGSGEAVDQGPSDAEIMANAQITAAQIQMQGAISGAQIGAGVQLNSDNKAAEVAMTQITAARDLGLAQVDAQKTAVVSTIQGQQAQYQAVIGSLPSLKKKDRDNVLKSLVTGDYGYTGPPGPGTITQIGQAAGGIGSAIGSIAGLFSDQRLKENIVYLGEDDKGGIYEYNYKGSNTRRRGRIAQDMARHSPEMVWSDPATGYLKVDARAL